MEQTKERIAEKFGKFVAARASGRIRQAEPLVAKLQDSASGIADNGASRREGGCA